MFELEAFEVLKIKEFTKVNDCFQDKSNEKFGHSGQTQFNLPPNTVVFLYDLTLPFKSKTSKNTI